MPKCTVMEHRSGLDFARDLVDGVADAMDPAQDGQQEGELLFFLGGVLPRLRRLPPAEQAKARVQLRDMVPVIADALRAGKSVEQALQGDTKFCLDPEPEPSGTPEAQ